MIVFIRKISIIATLHCPIFVILMGAVVHVYFFLFCTLFAFDTFILTAILLRFLGLIHPNCHYPEFMNMGVSCIKIALAHNEIWTMIEELSLRKEYKKSLLNLYYGHLNAFN